MARHLAPQAIINRLVRRLAKPGSGYPPNLFQPPAVRWASNSLRNRQINGAGESVGF